MNRKKIKQRISKLWKSGRKELNWILKETTHLAKEGEVQIQKASKKTEKNLEKMVLSLQRKKLYYELGKSLGKLSKNKWGKSKKIKNLLVKINNISRNIKKLR